MAPDKLNLLQLADGLTRPFLLQQIARLDYFAIYMYLARGVVNIHRHILYDELFYVVRGSLRIETDDKDMIMHESDLALVPKGIEHTSSSLHDSVVLIAQAQAEPERKNGHGSTHPGLHIIKADPHEVARGLTQTFFSVEFFQVDEMAVRAAWCQGVVGRHRHDDHDELLLVLGGQLEVATDIGTLALGTNEMIIIPHGRVHQLRTLEQTLLLSMVHSDISPSEQMGYTG
ncbi:MAG: cupin domain-containing protein [Chloroflexi bacterium]|nr:cupin domain-containing protein [Chloroflexota bacterium]